MPEGAALGGLRRRWVRWTQAVRRGRARFYYTALDAVYTACTRPERPRAELLRNALGGHSGNFHRIGAFGRFVEVVAPG